MNNNVVNSIEYVSIALASAIGVSQIESILGIIILCFQAVLIIAKCVEAVYKHIKSKSYDELIKELEEATQELNKLKENIGEEDGKQNR